MLYYKQTNNLVYIQRKAAQWNGESEYGYIVKLLKYFYSARAHAASELLLHCIMNIILESSKEHRKKMFSQLNFNLHQFKAFSLNFTIEMNLFTEYITLSFMAIWDMKIFRLKYVVSGRCGLRGDQRIYNEHELDALFDGFCFTAARRWRWQKGNEIHRVSDEVEDKVKNFHTRYKFSFQLEFKSGVKLSNIRLQSFIHGYRRKRKKRREKKMCWKHFSIAQRKSIKAMMKINGILHIILCWVCVCVISESQVEFFLLLREH